MKVGLICYNHVHLKTEQITTLLCRNPLITEIVLFALPFTSRPERMILFPHRPDQTRAVATEQLAAHDKVSFKLWDGQSQLEDCDVFLITGAGIINPDFANGRPIVNAHPGLIPMSRGLDSFKWAIHEGDEIGNTLHLIDAEVDKGQIIAIEKTTVYAGDSLETLARRHYENEIYLLSNFHLFLDQNIKPSYPEKEAHMRMSSGIEAEMLRRFDDWKARHALNAP